MTLPTPPTGSRTRPAQEQQVVAASFGYRTLRKVVVALAGGTLVATGVAMIFLPGPALLVIPLGLAILGLEFAWARRLLRRLTERSKAGLAEGEGRESTPTHPS